ncbi:sulfatase family protein [Flammeovirga kamogawensis]|uniref:Sulfatase-like hydrolase/transferase n=1 Tax=Flammeovirga kamogawensis TaxID=373891 RepID=A0ABX8H158_9BACT|nr:sulfatase-like hydrolase/transferase [Flammeovirga kamogawensis]MBB6462631.1 arylsulfatase A-like enzyme [Flammeovirga kamogawensis]QWG09624.1 sulfatase-like hydrolase/transferase [Flammeovirga kamogawensis]
MNYKANNLFVGLLLLLLSTNCGSISNKKTVTQKSKQPNVLVIMCDQLNYKALSCYGGPVPTPNIDRIAKEGVKFNRAYSATPFCSPSRASIVTGLYPHQHGVVHNLGSKQEDGININDETTGKLLNQEGYATHQYGKWHVESDSLNYLPYYKDQYDYAYQYKQEMADRQITVRKEDGQDWMNFYNQFWPVEVSESMVDKRDHLENVWKDVKHRDFVIKMGRLRLKPEDWIDDILANRTVASIKNATAQDKPFMITTSFIWPHDPNFVPDPYYGLFNPDSLQMPLTKLPETKFDKSWSRRMVKGYGDEGLREFLRIYYGAVKYLDDRVGRILGELEAQGVLDETLIIFTADHGDMMGEHGMVWKVNESFYDDIAAIPFMIRYPKLIKPGVSDIPVSLVDIKPTILSFTDTEYKEDVAGIDIIPFLTGEKDKSLAPKYSFCERIKPHPKGGREVLETAKGAFMVRGEQYKLVMYPDGDSFFYDLKNDPGESKNIINDSKFNKQILELENALQNWLDETGWKGAKVNYMYRTVS